MVAVARTDSEEPSGSASPPNEIDRRNHVGLRHTLVDCIRSRFAHSGMIKIFFRLSLCRGLDFRTSNLPSGVGFRDNAFDCSRCLLRDSWGESDAWPGEWRSRLALSGGVQSPGDGSLWLGSKMGNYKCLR